LTSSLADLLLPKRAEYEPEVCSQHRSARHSQASGRELENSNYLENWPANGDLVQSEVACNTDWVQQAARLRELLDQRFPRIS
jgi:hypothetical protein